MCVCMCVCVCTYICTHVVYVCIYIYIYIYIYRQKTVIQNKNKLELIYLCHSRAEAVSKYDSILTVPALK